MTLYNLQVIRIQPKLRNHTSYPPHEPLIKQKSFRQWLLRTAMLIGSPRFLIATVRIGQYRTVISVTIHANVYPLQILQIFPPARIEKQFHIVR